MVLVTDASITFDARGGLWILPTRADGECPSQRLSFVRTDRRLVRPTHEFTLNAQGRQTCDSVPNWRGSLANQNQEAKLVEWPKIEDVLQLV